jgi:hypothetical protein
VPLTEFNPVWPAGNRTNENQVLVSTACPANI